MLTINPPPTPPIPSYFFSFSFYLFSFTFQKKSENFGGGGGFEPPEPSPIKYALVPLYLPLVTLGFSTVSKIPELLLLTINNLR